MKLTIELNQKQAAALKEHAEKKGRSAAEDLLAVWWGRVLALEKYGAGGGKRRPYAPKGLDERERERLKAMAIKEGVAPKATKRKTPLPASRSGPWVTHPAKKGKGKTTSFSMGDYEVIIDAEDTPTAAVAKAGRVARAQKRTLTEVLGDAGRLPDGRIE